MFRPALIAGVTVLALSASGMTAVLPAVAKTNKAVGTHTVDRGSQEEPGSGDREKARHFGSNQPERRRSCGSRRYLEQAADCSIQKDSGLYRVKARIDSACKGSCDASYRISGSANHKLEVVPSCQPKGSGFVCSKVKIVKVY